MWFVRKLRFVACSEDRFGETYNALGNGLTDGVDLGSVTTTTDTDADVNASCCSNSLAHVLLHGFSLISSIPWLPDFATSCILHLLLHANALPLEDPSLPNPFPKSSLLPPNIPSRGRRTELVQTEEEDGLVDLEAQDRGLDEAQGLAVDLDEALAGLAVCDGGGGLLLAEALDGLSGRHFCGCG